MQMMIDFCERILPTMVTVSAVILADRFIDVQAFIWPALGITWICMLVAFPWSVRKCVWFRG